MNRPSRRLALSAAGIALVLPGTALADSPESGRHRTVTGIARVVVGEPAPGTGAVDVRSQVLVTDSSVIALTPTSDVPLGREITVELADSPQGAEVVRVTDAVAQDTAAAERGSAQLAADAPHQLYIGVVAPAGRSLAAHDATNAEVAAMVERVSSYWSDQTAGQLTFEVAGLVRYSSQIPCQRLSELWSEGFDRFPGTDGISAAYGSGKHLLLVTPQAAQGECGYGWGSLGSLQSEGNTVLVSDVGQSVWAHELGHNVGLDHANALVCDVAQDSVLPPPASCEAREYDDTLDVMGYSGEGFGEGNLNVPHLDDMGLQPGLIRTLGVDDTPTSVRLEPLSSTGTGPRGLRIETAPGSTYFVGYRTATGRDAAAGPLRLRLGVEVHRENPNAFEHHGSYLLDATTRRDGDRRRNLPVGGVLRTRSAHATITVTSQDPTGATVMVVNSSDRLLPARATIAAPPAVGSGQAFSVSTLVRDSQSTPSPVWPVTLQRRHGTGGWNNVVASRTDVRGTATVQVSAARNADYRWVTKAGDGVVRTSRVAAVKVS